MPKALLKVSKRLLMNRPVPNAAFYSVLSDKEKLERVFKVARRMRDCLVAHREGKILRVDFHTSVDMYIAEVSEMFGPTG